MVAGVSGLAPLGAPLLLVSVWGGLVTGCDIRVRDVVIPFRGRSWGKRPVVDTRAGYGFEPIVTEPKLLNCLED